MSSDEFIYPTTEKAMEEDFRKLREEVIIGKDLFLQIYLLGYKQGKKDSDQSLFEM